MAKDTPANRAQMRGRIAHLAARMIAVDGISDYGLAKRKAARQVGAPDSRNLPTNLEVEDALRAYQALYQADEHAERLLALRRLALEMMRLLEPFNPHLTGPVLSGSVGRHAEIHLHLYTDDIKKLEVFLLDQEIPFRARDTRIWSGDVSAVVPSFQIRTQDADYSITVLDTRRRRQTLRVTYDGRPLERAPIQSVESLVAGAGQ
jgi:hypothetical protein